MKAAHLQRHSEPIVIRPRSSGQRNSAIQAVFTADWFGNDLPLVCIFELASVIRPKASGHMLRRREFLIIRQSGVLIEIPA
jgi:hypothetical protein